MRVAADELRAELAGETATFVVNRNINFTNVCIVGCAFCGFGQGKRSPDAYHVTRRRLPGADRRGGRVRRDRDLHAGRDPPRLHARALRRAGCGWRRRPRRSSTCTPTRRWRSTTCASAPGRARSRSSTTCSSAGSARRRGPRAEVLDDGVRDADLAEQAAGRALGRDHRGLPPRRPALDLDGDVRPHRGALGARRAHAGDPRAAGAHRRDHRVRAAQLHPVQHAARAHPRDRGDLARREPQAHRRLPARARAHDPQPAGELGEDGARRGDREPALGRQRPRRDADGGEHLAHGGLPARGPARARGPDRAPRAAAGRTPAQRTTLYEIVETY